MKKKLLFVIPSLYSGGAEKSLITLLKLIDTSVYDVNLYIFRKEGLFKNQIPSYVKVLEGGENYKLFDGSAVSALKAFLSKGNFSLAVKKIKYILESRKADSVQRYENLWKLLSGALADVEDEYDVCIGYLEGTATYFALDRVKAKKYIGFLHTDYDRISEQKTVDEKYYSRIDLLAAVSKECRERAEEYFPCLKGKTAEIRNIVSRKMITDMSYEKTGCYEESSKVKILTVGRMSHPKGIDTAVLACALLVKRGYDVKWYHIGRGEQEEEIRSSIKNNSLESNFILLGEKENPYPYMRECDIYVQPSRFEGKSIAIDEAKCLAKPIAVTAFPTVFDQIEDGVNGIIAGTTPESLADKIELLIKDDALKSKLAENLLAEKVGNEEEINKFCELLEI